MWTDIARRLALEQIEFKTSVSPTLTAVASASREIGVDHDLAVWSILEYRERNTAVHRDIKVLAKAEEFVAVCEILHNDYLDVDCVFGLRAETDKNHMTQAILLKLTNILTRLWTRPILSCGKRRRSLFKCTSVQKWRKKV